MTKKQVTTKKIGVLMGGSSAERDISVRSGLAVYQALQEMGYSSSLIDVGADVVQVLRKDKVRLAVLALHGGMGENGAIQGMLDVLGVPYTGSGILASAAAMDKEISKKIFSQSGLNVPPYMVIKKNAKATGKKSGMFTMPEVSFPMPWVVKPVSQGSSIGVCIIRQQDDLPAAFEKAFSFGRRTMIEQYIDGREVHMAVIGDRMIGGVEVRPSLEFYNYEAKYTAGLTEYVIPPEIEDETLTRTGEMALSAHQSLGCEGVSRVDFRIAGDGTPYILEVNTLPGMTTTSLVPKIAKHAGMSFHDLIEEMIRLALKK